MCIQNVLSDWQNKNWDPAVNSNDFDVFCSYMNATLDTNIALTFVDDHPADIGLINYGKYTREVSFTSTVARLDPSLTDIFIECSYAMYSSKNPG